MITALCIGIGIGALLVAGPCWYFTSVQTKLLRDAHDRLMATSLPQFKAVTGPAPPPKPPPVPLLRDPDVAGPYV